MGLPVGKHIVPNKPLPVNDELIWDNGTPFPEPCIDRIAETVGKYEALAWMCGGLSFFASLGLLAVWNDKASKIPFRMESWGSGLSERVKRQFCLSIGKHGNPTRKQKKNKLYFPFGYRLEHLPWLMEYHLFLYKRFKLCLVFEKYQEKKTLGAPYRSLTVWDGVEERMRKKSARWKSQYISKGGRITLIWSTLASMPIYFMSMLSMPRKVRLRLERIQRDFLWGGGALERKLHLVRWDLVCLEKCNGGLGVKSLSILNKTLLCKWSWRFAIEREAFWNQVIRGKYGEEQGGWSSKEAKGGGGVWFSQTPRVYPYDNLRVELGGEP
ncbi:unnamed protein product, partial [Vitis vinifera]